MCILFSKKRRIPVASKTSVQAVQEKDVRPMPERYSENYDYNENGDSREKGQRRSVRRSAQEAAKKLKRNFAASYGDDDNE